MLQLRPNEHAVPHFRALDAAKRYFCIQTADSVGWSAPIAASVMGDMFVRIARNNGGSVMRLSLSCDDDGSEVASTIRIVVHGLRATAPLCIRNYTRESFDFGQPSAEWVAERMESASDEALPAAAMRHGHETHTVGPRQVLPYCWDAPSAPLRRLDFWCSGEHVTVDPAAIGKRSKLRAGGKKYILTTTLEQGVRNIHIEYNTPDMRSSSKSTSRLSTMQTTMTTFSSDSSPLRNVLSVSLSLPGIGLSISSAAPRELMYIRLTRPMVKMLMAHNSEASLEVQLQAIQVDNQLHEPLYPVMLSRALRAGNARSKASSARLPSPEEDPLLRAVIIVDLGKATSSMGVLHVRYASILLKELSIKVEEAVVVRLVKMLRDSLEEGGRDAQDGASDAGTVLANWIGEGNSTALSKALASIRPSSEATEAAAREVYFEVLQLQPIRLDLSFVRSSGSKVDHERARQSSRLIVRTLGIVFNVLSTALGNVVDAPLGFNALELVHASMPMPEIGTRLGNHYAKQVVAELYKVVLSVDTLGNPVNFFSNLASGVDDFFYEPYQGIVRSPQDFAKGVGRGTASLLKNSVFGLVDGISRITASVGTGLAEATFDADFQESRRRDKAARASTGSGSATNVLTGMAAGAKSIAMGVGSGVTGVFLQPVQGAKSEGVGGFFKGVGKGVAGLVTKPVVGVFDGASHITTGIKNTADMVAGGGSGTLVQRVRTPRFFAVDGVLRPYNAREATAAALLKKVDGGRFAHESMLAFVEWMAAPAAARGFAKLKGGSGGGADVPWMFAVTTEHVVIVSKGSLVDRQRLRMIKSVSAASEGVVRITRDKPEPLTVPAGQLAPNVVVLVNEGLMWCTDHAGMEQEMDQDDWALVGHAGEAQGEAQDDEAM